MSQIAQQAKRRILAAALALVITTSLSANPLFATPTATPAAPSTTQSAFAPTSTPTSTELPNRPLFKKSFPFEKATTIGEVYDIFLDLTFTISPYLTYQFGSKLPEKYQLDPNNPQQPETDHQYIKMLYQKALDATNRITTVPGSHEDIQRMTLQHYINTELTYKNYTSDIKSSRFISEFLYNFYPYDFNAEFTSKNDVEGYLDYYETSPLPFASELEVLKQVGKDQKYYLIKGEWQDDTGRLDLFQDFIGPNTEAQILDTFSNALKPLNLTEPERTKYLGRLQTALKTRLLPQFIVLNQTLQGLKSQIIVVKSAQEIPDHKTYYKDYLIPYNTSKQMTPEAIHQLGISEVKRIRIEIDKTLKAMKYRGTLKDCVTEVRKASKFYLGEESYPHYDKIIARINAKLPLMFSTKNIPTEVPTMSANEHTSYSRASFDGSQKATFNVGKTKQYELAMPNLTVHEGTLGHHLQNWNMINTSNVHLLNHLMYSTAYSEGWALYTEKLAGEYGIYITPQERLGMLLGELTRAGRLVVDTGINYFDWSYERGVKYMTDEALSAEADYEVSRYHYWPGQALSYKIGEIDILALRSEAQRTLGKRFNIKAWHEMVLSEGGITLDALRAKNTAFIQEQLKGK